MNGEPHLDIEANRQAAKYSNKEQVLRGFWGLARPLFRFSPRIAFGWRSGLLRLFGARIGRGVHVYPSVEVFAPWKLSIGDFSAVGDRAVLYDLGPITIGTQVTISQRAHLCAGTHDYSKADMPLLKLPIVIGDRAWVCADAFVGPNVEVGAGAVVGARAVVVRPVAAWTIVVGNPARKVAERHLAGGS